MLIQGLFGEAGQQVLYWFLNSAWGVGTIIFGFWTLKKRVESIRERGGLATRVWPEEKNFLCISFCWMAVGVLTEFSGMFTPLWGLTCAFFVLAMLLAIWIIRKETFLMAYVRLISEAWGYIRSKQD